MKAIELDFEVENGQEKRDFGGVEEALRRARHLPVRDRAMVEMVWRRGLPTREIGHLMGVSSGTVVRRMQRVKARLCDPVVRALSEVGEGMLPGGYREMGLGRLLTGKSVAQIAQEQGVTEKTVKEALAYLKIWAGLWKRERR